MQLLGEKGTYKFYYDGKAELPYSIYIGDVVHKEFKTRKDMADYYREHCIL
jgi:hypothetical protein